MQTIAFKIEKAKLERLYEIFKIDGNNESERMRNLCHVLLKRDFEKTKPLNLDSILELLEYDIIVLKFVVPILDRLTIDLNKIWIEKEPYFKSKKENAEGNLSEIQKEQNVNQ
jgi:hypothetical protein